MAGLARAGQLEVAKELARYFAENDFFGGFGAEGDAPGQGLRVLEDVAGRSHDPAFDQWLWPHVRRKAALILKMASTDKPLRGLCGPDRSAPSQSQTIWILSANRPAADASWAAWISAARHRISRPSVTRDSAAPRRWPRRLKHDEEADCWQAGRSD